MPGIGKILVLTAVTPDQANAGGRFVHHLLNFLGPERAAVALVGDDLGSIPAPFETLKVPLPPAPALSRSGAAISPAEETLYWLFRQRMLKKLADHSGLIAKFAAVNHVSHIVSVLDHPATIWLTRKVVDAMGLKYSTFTSELPESVLYYAGYDTRSKAAVFREFIEVLKSAQFAGFSSEAMARHCGEKYYIKGAEICSPVRFGGDSSFEDAITGDKIHIGSLINPRFMAATQSFIKACQEIYWSLNGKPIVLRLIGSASGIPIGFGGKPADIQILGGLSEAETIGALAQCQFNFLPSWTERQFCESARLCLPDQFPVFMSARRPVLALTLNSSLIEETIRDFSLGKAIVSCSETLLIPSMLSLLESAQQEGIKHNFARLQQERFSESQFNAGLRSLLPSSYIEKNSTA